MRNIIAILLFALSPFLANSQDVSKQNTETEKVESSNPPNDKQAANILTVGDDHRWRFGVGASLDLGARAESDLSIRDNSSAETFNGKAEFDLQNTLALELDARFTPANDWGFIGGLSYGARREIKSGKITIGNNTTIINDTSGTPDEIQLSILSASAVYRWNQFYLPFGLNYSFIDYKSTGLTVNADGGIGAQLGIGFLTNDQFTIEAFSRVVAFDIDYVDDDIAVNFTEGLVTSLVISGKFIF